jgi:hypothetical protein
LNINSVSSFSITFVGNISASIKIKVAVLEIRAETHVGLEVTKSFLTPLTLLDAQVKPVNQNTPPPFK